MIVHYDKDLERLEKVQNSQVSPAKHIGYLAFWVRKLKPVASAYHKADVGSYLERHAPVPFQLEVIDINERVAVMLAMRLVIMYAKKSVIDQIAYSRACTRDERTKLVGGISNYIRRYLEWPADVGEARGSNYESLVYDMRYRTFGPHHFSYLINQAIVLAAENDGARKPGAVVREPDFVSRQVELLRVFCSSPGDVVEERKALAEIVHEINHTLARNSDIRLEVIKWEEDTYPGFGADAQEVIDQQVGADYDVFFGIMWKRFGTPTRTAGSGTEAEFMQAFERWRANKESHHLMFFFKTAKIAVRDIDTGQLDNIRQFKEKLQTELGGLTRDFSSKEKFCTEARRALTMFVEDYVKQRDAKRRVTTAQRRRRITEDLRLLRRNGDDEPGDL